MIFTDLSGQNLFTVMPEDKNVLPIKAVGWAKKFRENSLNKNTYLINLKSIKNIQKEGKFNFKLPEDNTVYTASFQDVQYTDDDNYYWSGLVYNSKKEYNGELHVFKQKGIVYAQINVTDRHFIIEDVSDEEGRTNGNNIYYLIEKDAIALNQYKCGVISDDSKREHSSEISDDLVTKAVETRAGPPCPAVVRIMVVYTLAAANAVPNINTYINDKMIELQSIVTASRTSTSFPQYKKYMFDVQLSHVALTSINDNGASGEHLLIQLGANAAIDQLRTQTKSDLVVLISNSSYMTSTGNYGVARAPFGDGTYIKSNGFAVVHVHHTGRYTFAHEVGHMFGCYHSNDDPTTSDTERRWWAKGKVLDAINKRTIMAELPDHLVTTSPRIPFFSNPFKQIPQEYYPSNYNYQPGEDLWLGTHRRRQNSIHMDSTAVRFISQYETGSDPFTVFINGPSDIYSPSNFTWCPVFACGIIPNQSYAYQWSWSPDGFNYFIMGNSECINSNVAYFGVSGSPATIKLKVKVTGFGGVYSEKIIDVRIHNNIQPRPVSNDTQNLKLKESIEINIFPNPTANRTTIDIKLSEENLVSVDILDDFGNVERSLLSKTKMISGRHALTSDTSDLKPGIKYLRVIEGRTVSTKPFYIK